MSRATPSLLACALLLAPAQQPASLIERSAALRLIELGRTDNQVHAHLRELCLELGPRLTGSMRLEQAERWARDKFASFGLEARLEPWGEIAVGFDRGVHVGRMVAPEQVQLVFSTNAWTPGTGGVRRARAVLAPTSVEELERSKSSLEGAWLVWGSEGRPARELREAVEQISLAGEISASQGELVHTGGNPNVKWDSLPKRVRIRLRADQHSDLRARIGRGDNVELEFEIDNRFRQGPVVQHNVVADLVGSQKPDEFVIVSGHLDSWDGAQGAQDNGTGVATTLEAARLLTASGAKPARTIRFILWTGEEQGLMGSTAWVKEHADELPRISAVLNHDEGTNYLAGLTVTPEMMPAMRQVCAPLFHLNPEMPFELKEADGLAPDMSSDQAAFLTKGVPGFFWMQKGRADYSHIHHTQNDVLDFAIESYQRHSAVVAAVTALGLADAPELLDRTNMEPLEPRRMGVDLDGARLRSVLAEGKAKAAGWQVGDVIESIDGTAVTRREEITALLQTGGPVKLVVLKRGDTRLETTLDYSADKAEARRAERRAQRVKNP